MRTLRPIIIALAILSLVGLVRADDIYFRNGAVLKNCVVRDTADGKITVLTTTGQRTFPLTTIDRIVPGALDSSTPSAIVTGSEAAGMLPDLQPEAVDRRPQRLYLLPASALAFTLSFMEFDAAGSLSGDAKTKATIYGAIFLATGVANTILAFERVDVQASPVSLGVTYHF